MGSIIFSVPGYLVSVIVSLLVHPRIYHEQSSRFAKLRGGPAIGTALVIIVAVIKRQYIREEGAGDESTTDLLAMLWAAVEVAAGVFTADLLRGWQLNND